MSLEDNVNVADATKDFAGKGVNLVQEFSNWVRDNGSEIAIAGAVGIAIALLLLGLRAFGHRLIKATGEGLYWRTIIGRVLSKTSLYFIIMCAIGIVSRYVETPPNVRDTISFLFTVAAAFQAAIWGRELILGVIQHRVGPEEGSSTLGSALGLIRVLVTVALFAIAIVLILDNIGVNVTGLVAGLGIGGIAIGLAAQGIFSDLFAALSIIFDRPFRKGDIITFGGTPGTTGTVVNIGLKSTRIRSLGGEEVVISNTNLLNQQIQNWAEIERRRPLIQFGLVYQTDPDLLARIPHEVQQLVEAEPLATFDRCHLMRLAASSLDYELVFHVEAPGLVEMMQAQQNILIGMIRRFAELGAEFAYPTQTTFTAAPDGRLVMPYPEPREVAASVQRIVSARQ
jgi:small-conductance mechanosensitive channel